MKYIKLIASYIGITVILYLFGSFVAADFNIIKWDGMGRMALGMFEIILLALSTVLILDLQ